MLASVARWVISGDVVATPDSTGGVDGDAILPGVAAASSSSVILKT